MLKLNQIHAIEEVVTTARSILMQFATIADEPLTKDQSDSLGTLAVNCRLLMVECQAVAETIEKIRGGEWRDTHNLIESVRRRRAVLS